MDKRGLIRLTSTFEIILQVKLQRDIKWKSFIDLELSLFGMGTMFVKVNWSRYIAFSSQFIPTNILIIVILIILLDKILMKYARLK